VDKGYVGLLSAEIMRRGVLHIETEIHWHDELDVLLAAECRPPDGDETPPGQASTERAGQRPGNDLN